jgi:hypothetical protein
MDPQLGGALFLPKIRLELRASYSIYQKFSNLQDCRQKGAGSVCHSRESGSKTRLGENPNISFLLHNGCPLEFIPCLTRDGHDNSLFKLSHYRQKGSGTFWNFGTDFHPFLRFCDSRNGRKTVPSENVPMPTKAKPPMRVLLNTHRTKIACFL